MKERGVLFSAPMVKAIVAGTKTQTRRIVTPQPTAGHYLQTMWGTSPDGVAFGEPYLWREVGPDYPDDKSDDRRCPYGVAGDRLWVRETWREGADVGSGSIFYRADEEHHEGAGWKPSIFMPRWASRITLEVTAVRVERLQDITEEDARAEGAPVGEMMPAVINGDRGKVMIFEPRKAFSVLWDSINGKRAPWASNPWCWCITFRRLETP